MFRIFTLFFIIFSSLFLTNCNSNKKVKNSNTEDKATSDNVNLLTAVEPRDDDGNINAIIEIPAGTVDKWELNKSSGQIEWEMIANKPRVVNYIGYPGNYGMIPKTLLSKDNGGDGDPLDILVLGPAAERSSILKCKIIGVLYLSDNGEQDDKLIAVSSNSSLYSINTMEELDSVYKGVSEIVSLWFINYKGPGQMESKGFGSETAALRILMEAIDQYKVSTIKT